MAIGQRIKYFRKRKKLTQNEVGESLGFTGTSRMVRLAQYEAETRVPKADITALLANILDVSPQALKVPDIDSCTGLMHTLFAVEDMYGMKIDCIDGKVCLCPAEGSDIESYMSEWYEKAKKARDGEITEEEYDTWRYQYSDKD